MSTPRPFLTWPSAASLLYLLSAAFLLGGAAYVLAPGGGSEARIVERFAMLGTVQVYVAALAGLALLLCRWQAGNEDAEAVVVLLALFLPGMNAGLSTIASGAPWTALVLGAAVCASTVGWMQLIQRRVTGSWGWRLLLPLAVLQAWNALAPGALGLTYQLIGFTPEHLLATWLPGWWLHLAACVWLAMVAAGRAAAIEADEPLVRRDSLRWLLVVLSVTASGLHQWLLGYAFNLGLGVLDFSAAIVLTLLLADLVLRRFALVAPTSLAVWEGFVGFWATVVVTSRSFAATPDHLLSWACYPPLVLACGSFALVIVAWRTRQIGSAVSAAVWLLGAVFTWGTTADHDVANWMGVGAALLLLAAAVLVLPWRAPRQLELTASGVLLVAAWLHPGLAPAALSALVGVVHAWQHRRPLFGSVSSMPLAIRGMLHIPELLRAAGGWIAVGMAFLLLALGAWLSWRRTHGTPPAPMPGSPTPETPFGAAPQAEQPFTVEPFPAETPPIDAPADAALRRAPLPLIGMLACG